MSELSTVKTSPTWYPVPLALIATAVTVGLISEEIDFFVLASLAMKLREYTRNTPIRRNPMSKFWKKKKSDGYFLNLVIAICCNILIYCNMLQCMRAVYCNMLRELQSIHGAGPIMSPIYPYTYLCTLYSS